MELQINSISMKESTFHDDYSGVVQVLSSGVGIDVTVYSEWKKADISLYVSDEDLIKVGPNGIPDYEASARRELVEILKGLEAQ